jgi:hypothetical protein
MWTLDFWKATGERMIRSFAAAMVSVLVVGENMMDAFSANWQEALGVGLGAAVVSLLLSLAGNVTTGGGPAFINSEKVTTPNP